MNKQIMREVIACFFLFFYNSLTINKLVRIFDGFVV